MSYSIRSTVPVWHGTLSRLGLQGLTLLPVEISFSTQALFLRANEKQMLHQEEESMAHTSWACQLNGLNNLFTFECQVQGLVLSVLCGRWEETLRTEFYMTLSPYYEYIVSKPLLFLWGMWARNNTPRLACEERSEETVNLLPLSVCCCFAIALLLNDVNMNYCADVTLNEETCISVPLQTQQAFYVFCANLIALTKVSCTSTKFTGTLTKD